MLNAEEKKIRLRAHELCREIVPSNGLGISPRNELIIQTLMKEFTISHEVAEHHFNNNNSPD